MLMIQRPLALVLIARTYFANQKTPIHSNTFARKMNLTPKDARYMLRVYFKEYKLDTIKRSSSREYYMTPSKRYC